VTQYQYLIKYLKESEMNTIPAQEIKRRGIAAVDNSGDTLLDLRGGRSAASSVSGQEYV
jgi:hypothetical protein